MKTDSKVSTSEKLIPTTAEIGENINRWVAERKDGDNIFWEEDMPLILSYAKILLDRLENANAKLDAIEYSLADMAHSLLQYAIPKT